MAQLKPTQATQVIERVSDASACVRGVALQSVKRTHLLRCWAGEASTRGCATVCDSAALRGTQPRHCSRVQPAAAARERHRQHRKRPLVTCGPWVSRLVSHVRLGFRAGACMRLHGPTSDPPERAQRAVPNARLRPPQASGQCGIAGGTPRPSSDCARADSQAVVKCKEPPPPGASTGMCARLALQEAR